MPKTVMIFNDTPEILCLFDEILSAENYAVITHYFIQLSLETILSNQPDLIICDNPPYSYRDNEAWQVVKTLRTYENMEKLPLIVCTSSRPRNENGELLLQWKGVIIIYMPFDIQDLILAVESLIGKATSPEWGPLHPALV